MGGVGLLGLFTYSDHLCGAWDQWWGYDRTRLYDELRGTGDWPEQYDARAIANNTFQDDVSGLSRLRNKELYDIAVETEEWGRLTVFAYAASLFSMSAWR